MKSPARSRSWSVRRSSFAGFRFPAEVILVAVRWYLRYGLSYRDVEELLAERGIEVDHVTIYRWVQRFTPLLADAATRITSAGRRNPANDERGGDQLRDSAGDFTGQPCPIK